MQNGIVCDPGEPVNQNMNRLARTHPNQGESCLLLTSMPLIPTSNHRPRKFEELTNPHPRRRRNLLRLRWPRLHPLEELRNLDLERTKNAPASEPDVKEQLTSHRTTIGTTQA